MLKMQEFYNKQNKIDNLCDDINRSEKLLKNRSEKLRDLNRELYLSLSKLDDLESLCYEFKTKIENEVKIKDLRQLKHNIFIKAIEIFCDVQPLNNIIDRNFF